MVNSQASRHNQKVIPSSHTLPKACSNTPPHILKHLAAFGGAWGLPEVNIHPICGDVDLTMDVCSYHILTSGGSQTRPNAAKRFNCMAECYRVLC